MSGGFFDLFMGFSECGHDHGPEVFWLENGDFNIVVLALVMVTLSAE